MRKLALFALLAPWLAVSLVPVSLVAAEEDFDSQVDAALGQIGERRAAFYDRVAAGDVAGATAKLLAEFPAVERTPAQSLALGNLLFEFDRTASYELHKAAALAVPDDPMVAWEWAIEQHRAKQYAGAVASYQVFSAARPDSASPYALQADCLLRLGRIDEAIDAWKQSEKAQRGVIEQMENLVCAVNREPIPFARRAALLARVVDRKDRAAAVELVALDCHFPLDWWNIEPHREQLKHDVPAVLEALKLPENDLLRRAIDCAAECAPATGDADSVTQQLQTHNLIVDAAHTLPEQGPLARIILEAARSSKAVDQDILRKQFGTLLLQRARRSGDRDLWHMALGFGPEDPEEAAKLEREAWEATHDVLFACGLLAMKSREQPLRLDDEDLAAALQKYPEDGQLMRFAIEAAVREKKVTRELLVQGAKAELTHFTPSIAPATVILRPRSDYVRQYFAHLAKLRDQQAPGQAK